jgi:mono/diheme cytochrome c family protein
MSRKNKQKERNAGSAGAPERRVTEAVHVAGDEREPVAENRPVPVLLLALLIALLFWGDMYIMRNGGDVGGEAGAFPARVYDPYKRYADIPQPGGGAALGAKMYAQNCSICHQPGGTGIPGQFPPLAGSDWVLEEGPNRIIKLILNGIQGPITVSGQQFNNSMVPWRDTLTDEQIAAVATYIRSTWGNKAPPVKPEDVKAQRDATAARSTAWSAAELLAQPTK